MKEKFIEGIPYLEDIQVYNRPMPIYFTHWKAIHLSAFNIRQKVANTLKNGGLNLTLTQYDNTIRGVESLDGNLNYKEFITPQGLAGVEEWLKILQSIINLEIQGAKPLKKIQLTKTKDGSFIYYGDFYSELMELRLRIGFLEYKDEDKKLRTIDGALVEHRERSKAAEERIDSLILEQLPLVIYVEEVSK